MAIALRGTSSNTLTTSATSVPVGLPSGTVAGDFILIWIGLPNQVTNPPGVVVSNSTFTRFSWTPYGTNSTDFYAMYRYADGTEPANFTLDFNSSSRTCSVVCASWSGVGGTVGDNQGVSSTGLTGPSATATMNQRAVGIWGIRLNGLSTITWTAPTGWQSHVSVTNPTAPTTQESVYIADSNATVTAGSHSYAATESGASTSSTFEKGLFYLTQAPGLPTGTGYAYDIVFPTAPTPPAATGTGTAYAAVITLAPNSGSIAGSGTAQALQPQVPQVPLDSGTGVAYGTQRFSQLTVAAGTGVAQPPTIIPQLIVIIGVGTSYSTQLPVPQLAIITGTASTYAPQPVLPQQSPISNSGTAYAAQHIPQLPAVSGTGTANAPAAAIYPAAAGAAGTGTANAPQSHAQQIAAATGSGTGRQPTATVAPSASAPSGFGDCYNAGAGVGGQAGILATGQAYVAAVEGDVPAQAAQGSTSPAGTQSPVPQLSFIAGSGAANAPQSHAQQIAAATGTGTSASTQHPVPQLSAGTGSGSAYIPTVTSGFVAGCAVGSGAAPQPVASIATSSGQVSTTGAANSPLPAVTVSAGLASGTGLAYDPAQSFTAGSASGGGLASAAVVSVAPAAGLASGTGTAGDTGATSPAAALGAGQAFGASVVVACGPLPANGTGHAFYDPSLASYAGVATGLASSLAASAESSAFAALASGSGSVHYYASVGGILYASFKTTDGNALSMRSSDGSSDSSMISASDSSDRDAKMSSSVEIGGF